MNNYKKKKELFSEIRDRIYHNADEDIYEVKISSLKNSEKIVEEIKSLKVIKLDNLEDFLPYLNYDHFLIFKVKNEYYFCDTELTSIYDKYGIIRVTDFKHHLRKDKMKKINDIK